MNMTYALQRSGFGMTLAAQAIERSNIENQLAVETATIFMTIVPMTTAQAQDRL